MKNRNLSPRPSAIFAMYHWPHDYGSQRLGVMDFFDALHPGDQKYCNDAVTAIVNAGLEWGIRLKAGEEAAKKPHPTLIRKRKKAR